MTDKKTEALKLALEALEEIHPGNMTPMAEGNWNKAIAAIREALAEQQAQQQEPVATVTSESGNPNVSMSWWHEPALPVGTKLYASPPASKPWVGLTVREIEWCFEDANDAHVVAARNIEAKLKEKNHG